MSANREQGEGGAKRGPSRGSNTDQGFGGGRVKSVPAARGLGDWSNRREDSGNPAKAGDNQSPRRSDVMQRGVSPRHSSHGRDGHMVGKKGTKSSPKANTTSNPLR